MKLTSISTKETYTSPTKSIVYDIEVEKDHSFCVGSNRTVVHNCTTRLKAAIGYPQLSAVVECADAAHGLGGHIISDGGCTTVADFSKAFGAGADIVMSGSFFATVDEADCEREVIDGKTYCYNYGMSSKTAQNKYGSGLKEYRSSEGRTVLIPATGPVDDVIKDILGGIRSCCTYVGAKKIKELPKRTTFIKVNNTHNRVNEENTIGN